MSPLKSELLKRFEEESATLSSLERARLMEALDWAVGFLRCRLTPEELAKYPDYRNLEQLVADGLTFGPFQFVMAQNELMLQTIQKAEDACRDNLKAYQYKNEQALLDALKDCEKWTKTNRET